MSSHAVAVPRSLVGPSPHPIAAASLLAVPACMWAAMALHAEVPIGFVLLCLAALVFRAAARARFGTAITVVGAFFAAAICHAIFGYFTAGPTSVLIWVGTAADRVFATAFLIVSAGLLASAVGYMLSSRWEMSGVRQRIARLNASDRKFIRVTRVVAVTGTVVMIGVYASVGFVPLMVASFSGARYLSAAGDEYVLQEWVAARALDLLTFSIPVVFGSALWQRRRIDWLIGMVGSLALLLPLRRANVLTVVFVVLIVAALRSGRVTRKVVAAAVAMVAVYAVSQVLFSNFAALANLQTDEFFIMAGGALPEVRDLGWTLELIGDERLNGTTFAQALVPIPSFASEASQKYSLRSVTSKLIGLDMDRRTGGLRLTLPGEAFLNFDIFGPVIVGVLFGMLCAAVEVAFNELRCRGKLWAYIAASFLFVWTCFWLHLGGTQSGATIKIGLLLLGGGLVYAREKQASGIAASTS